IYLCAAELRGKPARRKQRRGTPCIFFQQALKLPAKVSVAPRLVVLALQFLQGRHQRFRDVPAAVAAESPSHQAALFSRACFHSFPAPRTAATNASSFAGSFRPGSRSTPVTTSTPQDLKTRIASPTLSGVNPPAITNCPVRAPS